VKDLDAGKELDACSGLLPRSEVSTQLLNMLQLCWGTGFRLIHLCDALSWWWGELIGLSCGLGLHLQMEMSKCKSLHTQETHLFSITCHVSPAASTCSPALRDVHCHDSLHFSLKDVLLSCCCISNFRCLLGCWGKHLWCRHDAQRSALARCTEGHLL